MISILRTAVQHVVVVHERLSPNIKKSIFIWLHRKKPLFDQLDI